MSALCHRLAGGCGRSPDQTQTAPTRGGFCLGKARKAAGFTLFELIIALVILSIGSVLLLSFVTGTARSVEPMIQAQARAIASAYMDEILLRSAAAGSCADRATYESINCYDGLDEAPHDQFGNPIAALGDYRVGVTVSGGQITVRVRREGSVDLSVNSIRGDY